MREIDISGLFSVLGAISSTVQRQKDNEGAIGKDYKEHWTKVFPGYQEPLEAFGLSASLVTLRKLESHANTEACTWPHAIDLLTELRGRLIDEAGERTFFSLHTNEVSFFRNPTRGWELSLQRFPDINGDVEEASKCLALSRYAGAVFHSVQIIEHGLIELGSFLRVTDPHSGWTAVSGALQKVIDKKHPQRTHFEKKNFAFLEQMQGLVHGLKNAWRNKISHAHGRLVLMSAEFSPETSEEILMATRAFMRRLAEELPPPKPKKASKK